MDKKAVEQLYHDALLSHIKGMGIPDYVADYEAARILKRLTGQ